MAPILEQLFRLRLVVARYGEMDRAGWWNTNGVLGMRGETVLRRSFPRTAPLAQARVAFAVARARCSQAVGVGDAQTLWNLPAAMEDQFETEWQAWLNDPEPWRGFLHDADQLGGRGLVGDLCRMGLLTEAAAQMINQLRADAQDRGVLIGTCREIDSGMLSRLAAAFSLGKPGHLVVPYMRVTHSADA